jgi:hypothetical protein
VERGQFTFYKSYYDAIIELPKRDQTAVLLAICAYALYEEEPQLSGAAKAVFLVLRPVIDSSRKKAESGKQGASKREANRKQTASKPQANRKLEQGLEKELEKEKEKELDKEQMLNTPKPPTGASRFVPPTIDEVAAYVRERKSAVDPQYFVDFYTKKGWKVGRDPMEDWKAACRNAESWDRWGNKPHAAEIESQMDKLVAEFMAEGGSV